MSLRQTSCQACAFCQWTEKSGEKIQTGCKVGQLDRYKKLKDKVDPVGHPVDNKIFKLTEMGDVRAYIINMACTFQRSASWAEEHLRDVPPEGIRKYVFDCTPFDYGLVVVSDGQVRSTLKTVKHVCNGTVPPRWVEIVNRPKHNSTRFIEETILALKDRMSKDITVPDPSIYHKDDMSSYAVNARSFINFRQMADDFPDDNRELVLETIKARHGYFWVLVLQANTKIDAGFMESIKRLVLDLEVDFHIITLNASGQEAVIVAPVLLGAADFHPSAAFVYKSGNQSIRKYGERVLAAAVAANKWITNPLYGDRPLRIKKIQAIMKEMKTSGTMNKVQEEQLPHNHSSVQQRRGRDW